MRPRPARPLLVVAALSSAACAASEDNDRAPPSVEIVGPVRSAAPSTEASAAPDTHFEGRELAQTMSHLGAEWLIRDERQAEENVDLLHGELGLERGDTACDFGAGNGFHTLRMANAVGPGGTVVAVDLQPEMLGLLETRASAAEISNIETVLAGPTDPRLGSQRCDLILLVDVYHELAAPEILLQAMGRALKTGGRIALVEYRAEDPDVPIKALHKMSRAQILREFSPERGFTLESEFDGLPWQHLMFFGWEPASNAGGPSG